jgi:hypothetical protein
MKKTKIFVTSLVILSIILSITPNAIPQVGKYTFHGAPGDEKILKVRTVNNQSLEDLFGSGWVGVIEMFGEGAEKLGARRKSVVTAVNFNYILWGEPGVEYTTDNWDWTLGEFNETPDSTEYPVYSFYDPKNITWRTNLIWGENTTIYNGALYFAQLPTPVDEYLAEITWAQKWENTGNTVVHHAEVGKESFSPQYYEDCTETWTYGETYGAWIGYKIEDNESNVIYEFSIDLPTSVKIPGFEVSIVLGVSICTLIGLIYIKMKKKK